MSPGLFLTAHISQAILYSPGQDQEERDVTAVNIQTSVNDLKITRALPQSLLLNFPSNRGVTVFMETSEFTGRYFLRLSHD